MKCEFEHSLRLRVLKKIIILRMDKKVVNLYLQKALFSCLLRLKWHSVMFLQMGWRGECYKVSGSLHLHS